ncbi:hypothetical protein TNCV_3061981 [Trichonephila clavipes]|nr:hypothetical protein TNCV_3061981 [Trichonephila clavipes]
MSLPSYVLMSPLQTPPSMVCPVNKRAANYLKEAVRSFTTIEAGVDRRSLISPSVVHSQILSCSVLVCPQLPNSNHCGTVPLHTSSYCVIGKSSFSKADNPLRSKEKFRRNLQNFECNPTSVHDLYHTDAKCHCVIILVVFVGPKVGRAGQVVDEARVFTQWYPIRASLENDV